MKLSAAAAMTAVILACLPVAAPAQNVAAGLDKIAAYAGTWKTTIVHVKTDYSAAGTESSSLRNDCWRSEDYYACHQFVNGPSAGLIVFTYDAKHDAYTTYNIPAGGGDSGSGTLLIAGDTWTFPWQFKKKDGKTVYARVVNIFHGANTIEFRQEFSTDQIHWIVAATGHEERQP